MRISLAGLTLVTAALCWPALSQAQTEVSFPAADGLVVFGDWHDHQGEAARGTLILFHQANASVAEYAPLIPDLTALGFDVLAMDQRAGGRMFEGQNRTRAALPFSPQFDAVLPDLQATLDHAVARGATRPLILVGSSYSAGLVFSIAARNPGQVDALAAFSPANPFSALDPAAEAASLTIPVFITSDHTPGEVAAAGVYAENLPPEMVTQFVPDQSIHGAAALRADLNAEGAGAVWAAFTDFLDKVAG